jgi:glycosyltransferase involved in cell wall biosynthesis
VNSGVKILFIIRYFYPFIGGTEKQALALASRVVKKGIPVTIVTSRFEMAWPRSEFMEGVQIVRLSSPRVKGLGALIFLACLVSYLVKHRKQFSHIHTFQIGYTSFMAILISHLLKKPSLLKVASSGTGGDVQKARQTPWGRLFLAVAKKASQLIAVSTAVEEELMAEDVNPVQLSRISNGVDVEAFKPGEDKSRLRKVLQLPDKKTIIYTGRLSAEKGVDFLVRSFSKVAGRRDCQLIIIGDGPEREYLLQLLDNSCRDASVHLLTSTDDVAGYLNASDLFILPSRFEGLSNSLLEAMACALPVISTRVGGSTDIIEQGSNGLLIDTDNEEEVHSAIARVFDDPDLAVRLGKKARETVEGQHDLSSVADRYVMVYKKLGTNYHA